MEMALLGQETMHVPQSRQYLGSISALRTTLIAPAGHMKEQISQPVHLALSIFIFMVFNLYLNSLMFLPEQEGKNNVTCAAGQPDGEKEEQGNGHSCRRIHFGAKRHCYMEKGSEGAEQNVPGMGKPGGRPPAGKSYAGQGQRIDKPPFLNESQVQSPIWQIQENFSDPGYQAVTEASDSD